MSNRAYRQMLRCVYGPLVQPVGKCLSAIMFGVAMDGRQTAARVSVSNTCYPQEMVADREFNCYRVSEIQFVNRDSD
jgi:hypothetical protein